MRHSVGFSLFTILWLALVSASPSFAQQTTAEQSKTQVPNERVLLTLIHNTILQVNNANLSGNYTVLRDLAAPILAGKTDSLTFADSFRSIRAKKTDLSSVILFTPKLKRQPYIDKFGVLRVSGFYPTTPLNVHFNFGYMKVSGRWRLAGVQMDLLPSTAKLRANSKNVAIGSGATGQSIASQVASNSANSVGADIPIPIPTRKPWALR